MVARLKQLAKFLIKDYPAYLRSKPSLKRVLQLPFLIVYILLKGRDG